jgi:hypothetical protein
MGRVVMRILVTASEWNTDRDKELKKILTAGKAKHGDDLTIVVGYTAPHVKIAMISYDMGIETVAFSPDLESLPSHYLIKSNGITITSLGQIDYLNHVASKVNSVIAFDKKDPLIYHAKKNGKKIWYPLDHNNG